MEFDEYQKFATGTAIYPERGTVSMTALSYCALGLCGESGEIAEKIKKIIRDNNGKITEEARQAIKKELGDPLWYIANMAHEFGFSLNEIAIGNIEKLQDRKNRNVLKGNGDDR